MTYEQSIERKDEVIANLTRAMQKQRDKFEMAKTFCEWKIRHNDSKREVCKNRRVFYGVNNFIINSKFQDPFELLNLFELTSMCGK